MTLAGIAPALRFALPLPVTAALGQPGQVRVIPRVYGRKWTVGIPTLDKYTWILASHHLRELTGISGQDVAGNKLAEAQLINTVDPDGRPIAIARVPRVAQGSPMFLVLGNSGWPGDIVADLLNEVAGLNVPRSQFDGFAGSGELAGRVEDPTRSIQSAIDEICLNAGARWSRWRPGNVLALPIAGDPIRAYDRRDLFGPHSEVGLDGIANRIRVLYDSGQAGTVKPRTFPMPLGMIGGLAPAGGGAAAIAFNYGSRLAVTEAPSGELEQSLSGEVPGSIRRYGPIELSLELRWVTTLAQAARVLGIELASRSRPLLKLTADTDLDLDLYPGDRVDIDDLHVPALGPLVVATAEPDIANHRTGLVLEAAVGPAYSSVIHFPEPAAGVVTGLFPGLEVTPAPDVDESVTEPPEDTAELPTEAPADTSLDQENEKLKESFIVAVSDETTPIVVAAGLREIRMPYDFLLSAVQATATSNETNAAISRVAVRAFEDHLHIAEFNLRVGNANGRFTEFLLTKYLPKGTRVIFDVTAIGDGDITGLKFNLVGRKRRPGEVIESS